jgi:hypothetical protein
MEPIDYNSQPNEATSVPVRPDFLKILCILSFVACGLMILICGLGSLFLAMGPETIDQFWPQVVESNPPLEEVDPLVFFHQFGMLCVYTLLATIFSLIGVIMMWRLERLGFLIYVVAELSTHFFSMDMGVKQNNSSFGLILGVAIDLVFIAMYLANLKHMNRKAGMQSAA